MDIAAKQNTAAGRLANVAPVIPALIAVVFYWLTCFRTFTWWDSSEYSAAALVLGVPHPPGSLITVLIGWLFTWLPLAIDKFFVLNLLAALMAAVTVYLVGLIALRLSTGDTDVPNGKLSVQMPIPVAGAAIGALYFGLSLTTWYYAIRFTPYMTTALLTAVIILTMIAWLRRSEGPHSHLWLGLVLLLFGLDFSIHRTNLLMLPGFLIWILIIRPRTFLSVKHWIYAIAGLIIGLIVQLLIIPMASARPFINFNNPDNFTRFWNYITLKQYGGGWLINILPRKAAFWDVQFADYIKVFGDNFANNKLFPLGYLPLLLGLAGVVILFKRNWKLGTGLALMFICASLGAIIYFNLPLNFFRSIDRHYLPSFVIFGIFIAAAAGALIHAIFAHKKRYRVALIIPSAALLLLMPVQAAVRNFRAVDGARSYFAYDTARNYLANLPADAILFTQSDIDTYTLWNLQIAENLRPDVTVCNLSLINTPWFLKQIFERDRNFPFRLDDAQLDSLAMIPWQDSTIVLATDAASGNDIGNAGDSLPAQIEFTVSPNIQGKYLLPQDQILMKTLLANNWKRPICISSLISGASVKWLKPYLRLEGLYWRLVPARSPEIERQLLSKNLLEKYNYRNYGDPNVLKEPPTKWLGWNLYNSFLTLSFMQSNSGDSAGCRETIGRMLTLMPPKEIEPPAELMKTIDNACR